MLVVQVCYMRRHIWSNPKFRATERHTLLFCGESSGVTFVTWSAKSTLGLLNQMKQNWSIDTNWILSTWSNKRDMKLKQPLKNLDPGTTWGTPSIKRSMTVAWLSASGDAFLPGMLRLDPANWLSYSIWTRHGLRGSKSELVYFTFSSRPISVCFLFAFTKDEITLLFIDQVRIYAAFLPNMYTTDLSGLEDKPQDI